MKITFNVDLERKARRASEAAAKATFQQLNARFQAALATPAFEWNAGVTTTRSNGQKVDSPRNIVDTGLLRQSNSGPEINGLRVTYTWRTPYSVAVHEGAILVNGASLPARPWTSAVLGIEPVDGIPVFDYAKVCKDTWLRVFNSGS